ncbi:MULTISPECIES: universal stress protein [Arthrobacter]|uniref:UspA domain-containing protein n=1 Tax=Arthrobacter humicola TaxID=409291 RepID=A0ABN2Z468_9MICC|nr:universal stress protein [Arthrobacter sp. H-02-3]PVZ57455.1 universal stress protein [Arthrobacter sp. H-02-3]
MAISSPFVVVVGVDGSTESQAALDWGIQEAKLRNGQVIVLASWHYPYVTDAAGQAWDYAGFERDAQTILNDELERVADQGVPVTGRLVEGNAAAALVEASREADLLIVGSRGLGGFTGMLLGSVSSQLAHHARCPLLIIRTGDES